MSMSSSSRGVRESPEVKHARSRLGNLLEGIRNTPSNDQSSLLANADRRSPDDSDEEDAKGEWPSEDGVRSARRDILSDGGARRRRRDRAKKVVFELRGKPFELADLDSEQNMFRLCRSWISSRDDGDDSEKIEYPEPPDDTLDLLATKEIYALPRPRQKRRALKAFSTRDAPAAAEPADLDSRDAILASYKPRWQRAKQMWLEDSKLKQEPYGKSLTLLETVYNIAQQNQIA